MTRGATTAFESYEASDPFSGATMLAKPPERATFVRKAKVVAGALAASMLSAPVLEVSFWMNDFDGETVNRDLAFADALVVGKQEVDLDTLHLDVEVMPLPQGFVMAELPPQFSPIDPDTLELDV